MNLEGSSKHTFARLAVLTCCFAVLAWRIAKVSPKELWRDIAAVISVYCAAALLVHRPEASRVMAGCFMVYLLIVHAVSHLPHSFQVLGLAP